MLFEESYISVRSLELYWHNAHLSPLPTAQNRDTLQPTRPRKLLAHKQEIAKLFGKAQIKGYTIVPLTLYEKRSHFKLEIGIGKGKTKTDKRTTIKDREWKRSQQKILKRHQ